MHIDYLNVYIYNILYFEILKMILYSLHFIRLLNLINIFFNYYYNLFK